MTPAARMSSGGKDANTLTTPVRRCAAGCGSRMPSHSGRGRRAVYCSADCRRSVEYGARRHHRAAVRPVEDDSAPLAFRITNPVALARNWIFWRYPAGYVPKWDAVSPSGFRVALAYEDWRARAVLAPDVTALYLKVPVNSPALWESEIRAMARWIKGLPVEDQRDFASRAAEAVADSSGRARHGLMGHEDQARHPAQDVLEWRPDPVTLPALRRHYSS
jgi:hypothetical protein